MKKKALCAALCVCFWISPVMGAEQRPVDLDLQIGPFDMACGNVEAPGCSAHDFENPSVVTVDGCPVHLDEFSWFMRQERAAVFHAVTADYPLDSGEDFWNQDCNGITPRDLLLEKTVESVVREKSEQLLFEELELIDDIRYSVFIEHLEKLNGQRQKTVEEGRVIYGPVQYSARQYYSHWMATMQIKAKDTLRNKQPEPEEAELRDYYCQNRHLYQTAASWTLKILVVKGRAGAQGREMESVAEDIMLNVRQERTLEAISKDYTEEQNPQVSLRRVEKMDEGRLGELFPNAHPSLVPGRTIQLPMSSDEIWIVKAVSFFPADDVPYEEIRHRLIPGFVNDAYDKMIQTRIQDAHIEINQKVIEGIQAL